VSIGRRKVSLDDPSAWVFNKMVDAYRTRPAYPETLVDAIASRLTPGARILDVGAGLGHLAVPLSARGFRVTAVEPAIRMLECLHERVRADRLSMTVNQAQAENLPFADDSFDAVLLADALHFIDSERASREMARVLGRKGQLAVLSWDFAHTPFMQALRQVMEEAAPRRPRNVTQSIVELFAVAGLSLPRVQCFAESLPVTSEQLDNILRSISFIGPAMNPSRFEAFQARVRAIPHSPVWSRDFALYQAKRG
jgi:ubiquinone/menaquinone biosynthesis C-methylase UbiE